jgi:hypothetical protein
MRRAELRQYEKRNRKRNHGHASQCCSRRIECCGGLTASCSVEPCFSLASNFVTLNQSRAGAKNRGQCQKQATDRFTVEGA